MSAGAGHRYFQVDVFSLRPGLGNPLAVVLDAGDLDLARMQAIARWHNLAETTFLLPPATSGADYRVRIFTTQREIAFAGHPSIGSAHVALATGLAQATDGVLIQECQAGLLPIRVLDDGDAATLSVRVPRSQIVRYGDGADAPLQAALHGRVRGRLQPALVEGGRRWWLAELADEAQVRGMQPDFDAIRGLAEQTQSLGLCVFARCGERRDRLVVRAFPLGVGISEDPASGAANAAIAAFLDEAQALDALGTSYLVSQGREMGRDAELRLHIDGERHVWVGGRCQTVIRGSHHW